MIDTIVLTMKNNEFEIIDWKYFEFFSKAPNLGYSKAVCNPNAKIFGYSPRLTYENRFDKPTLRIEFSAPKLIFNNNFDEIEESDFELIVQKLFKCLTANGVGVIPQAIRQADVSTIHFSKNIILTDYTNCNMILNELGKANLSKWFDVNTRDYKNGGHTLYISTKSGRFNIVFYDKVKELQQEKITKKARVEKDGAIQLRLLDNFENMKPFEVLRMEVRICERRKIKQLMEKLKIETQLKFENLFNKKITKAVLQDQWQKIEDSTSYLSIETKNESRLIQRIIKANPKIMPKKALAVCATMMIIKEVGTMNFRKIMSPVMKDRFWYDYQPEVREAVKDLLGKNYLAMAQVSKQLEDFKPVKLKNYPNFEI